MSCTKVSIPVGWFFCYEPERAKKPSLSLLLLKLRLFSNFFCRDDLCFSFQYIDFCTWTPNGQIHHTEFDQTWKSVGRKKIEIWNNWLARPHFHPTHPTMTLPAMKPTDYCFQKIMKIRLGIDPVATSLDNLDHPKIHDAQFFSDTSPTFFVCLNRKTQTLSELNS